MSIVRPAAHAFGGQVLSVVVTLATGILFSRVMGPDGVGRFDVFRVALTIVVTVAALGIGSAAIYVINHLGRSVSEVVTNSLRLGVWLGLGLALAVVAAVRFLPQYFGETPLALAIVYALSNAASLIVALLSPALVAQFRIGWANLVALAGVGAPLIGGAIAAPLGALDPPLAIYLLAVGQFAALGLLLAAFRREIRLRLPHDRRLLRTLLAQGVKLAAASLLYMLSLNSGVILLKVMRGEDFLDVGLYSRAMTIAGLVTLVPRGIGPLLYSKWSGAGGPERVAQVELVARLNTAYALVCTVGLWVFGEFAITLLFGTAFARAQDALVLIAPALGCFVVYDVFNNLLAAAGRAGVTAAILAASLAIVLGVSATLIPEWGIRGAALGTLAGNAFMALSSMIACGRMFGVRAWNCLVPTARDAALLRARLRPIAKRRGAESAREE